MLEKVKIKSPKGTAQFSTLEINDKVFPYLSLNLESAIDNIDTISVTTFIRDFEFDGEANLIINGVLVGLENEKRLYEQLKEKFDNGCIEYPQFELTEFQDYIRSQMGNLFKNNKEVFIPLRKKYRERKGYLQYIYDECKVIKNEKYMFMDNKSFAKYAAPIISGVFGFVNTKYEIKITELERNLSYAK